MFEYKKYKLRFCKSLPVQNLDSMLLTVLLGLQDTYKFEILHLDFGLTGAENYVTIRCIKGDHVKIFAEFVEQVGDYISDVVF